jgi:hypothetical protein
VAGFGDGASRVFFLVGRGEGGGVLYDLRGVSRFV